MSTQQRPTAILVFGVLHLVFGALGILGLLGSAAILFTVDPSNPMYPILRDSEFYRVYLWASSAVGLLAIIALIAAGVGLLLSQNWARVLSIGYAVYAILAGLAGMVVSWLFVVSPLIAKASVASGPAAAGAIGGAIGGMVGSVIGLIYPVAIIIFMTRRKVVAYFHQPR